MNSQIIESLTALIAGMGTVFIVLILISLVIGSFQYISKHEKHTKGPSVKIDPVEYQKDQDQASENEDMKKIVAAISLALSYELGISADRLRIRSLRRS